MFQLVPLKHSSYGLVLQGPSSENLVMYGGLYQLTHSGGFVLTVSSGLVNFLEIILGPWCSFSCVVCRLCSFNTTFRNKLPVKLYKKKWMTRINIESPIMLMNLCGLHFNILISLVRFVPDPWLYQHDIRQENGLTSMCRNLLNKRQAS